MNKNKIISLFFYSVPFCMFWSILIITLGLLPTIIATLFFVIAFGSIYLGIYFKDKDDIKYK